MSDEETTAGVQLAERVSNKNPLVSGEVLNESLFVWRSCNLFVMKRLCYIVVQILCFMYLSHLTITNPYLISNTN